MVADRIRFLREDSHMTQTELSKKLGITRASVNAWEMGISVPSTQYVVELARIFNVSTDFILGLHQNSHIDVSGLTDDDIRLVCEIIAHLKRKTNSEND